MIRSVRSGAWAGWLALLAVWTGAAIRTVSYVDSGDPRVYIVLGRNLLLSPLGSPEWLAALREVAPGYPLILAGAIRCFGEFAPYWVNFVLGCLWGLVLHGIFRRLAGPRWAAVTALAGTCAVLFLGHALHWTYLLRPFRELAAFLFMSLGLGLFLAGWQDRRDRWLPLAGLCFALGGVVREATLLVTLGPLAAILAARERSWRTRGRSALLLLSPILVLAAAAVALSFSGAPGGIKQAGSWCDIVFGGGRAELGRRWCVNLGRYAALAWSVMGWGGLLLIAAGVWRSRRQPAVAWAFLLPAALLLVGYSTFIVDGRYFLSILVLLVPLAGLGVWQATEWIAAAVRRKWARCPEAAPGAIATGGLCLALLAGVGRLPAGSFSRADATGFRDALHRAVRPADLMLYDIDCREAFAAVTCYTHVRGGWLYDPAVTSSSGRRVFYLEPLNKECRTTANVAADGMRMGEVLRAGGALVPVAPEVPLGPQRFALRRLAAYATNAVARPLDPPVAWPAVLWIDLRHTPDGQTTRCRIESTVGGTSLEGPPLRGGGWKGWYVPHWPAGAAGARLVLESDAVLPSEGGTVVRGAGEPAVFDMANERRYSTMAWFPPPCLAIADSEKHGILIDRRGGIEIPIPAGTPPGTVMHLALTLATVQRGPGRAQAVLASASGFSAAEEILLNRPQQTARWQVPVPPDVERARFDVELRGMNGSRVPPMRVERIALGPFRAP